MVGRVAVVEAVVEAVDPIRVGIKRRKYIQRSNDIVGDAFTETNRRGRRIILICTPGVTLRLNPDRRENGPP